MSEVALDACGVHAEREAVARCDSCGRGVCLDCAVPFRGGVLCAECAAREVGEPAPAIPTRRSTRRPEVVAATLLSVALLATIPPWDGFGPWTGVLSAWRATPAPWPLLASIAVLGATIVAVVRALRWGRKPASRVPAVYAGFATVAAGATTWQVFGSPDYVSHTPAPFVVLALSAAGALIGFSLLRRGR